MGRLADRVAVVTGGGSGIGRAIGLCFAAEGARVAVADVDAEGAERVAAEITAAGGRALAVPTDVADSAQVDALVARVVDSWGRLDVLVNNAGIATLSAALQAQLEAALGSMLSGGPRRSFGVTSHMTDAEWRRMLEVHLYGTFHCTRAALRVMEPAGRGAIVNLASVAGLAGIPSHPHYGAAKAGIIGFTKSVAQEVGAGGIRVNAIAPGLVDTPMTADTPPVVRQMMLLRTPLGRAGGPEEIASVALFLASDEASFVTGQVVSPNGGLYT
jgi:3-oxoacyl-[acyl-carrier protein] reductase